MRGTASFQFLCANVPVAGVQWTCETEGAVRSESKRGRGSRDSTHTPIHHTVELMQVMKARKCKWNSP